MLATLASEVSGSGSAGIGAIQAGAITAGLILVAAGHLVARLRTDGFGLADIPLVVGWIVLISLAPLALRSAGPEQSASIVSSGEARLISDRLLQLERSVLTPRRDVACRPPAEGPLPTVHFEPILEGLGKPVYVATATDGSGRLFVVEKGGTIRIGRNGEVVETPFLDIRDRVVSDDRPPAGWEQGLLGLAFPPDFATSGSFYVHYNAVPDGRVIVGRYRVTDDPDRADATAEEIVLEIPKVGIEHNGGQLAFGPDGYLYVGLGDGDGERWPGSDMSVYGDGAVEYVDGEPVIPAGSGFAADDYIKDDAWNSAQHLGRLLGKILRIDVSGPAPYVVPEDNPFIDRAGAEPAVWAYGFRNPWRFSFDECDGALFVADVGRSDWEEVNLVEPGGNYGWRIMEAGHCYPPGSRCDPDDLKFPIAEYGHLSRDPAGGGAVIGGYVYRGRRLPALVGRYVFADFMSSRIWALTPTATTVSGWRRDLLAQLDFLPSSFGVDGQGELMVVDYGGTVHRMLPSRP